MDETFAIMLVLGGSIFFGLLAGLLFNLIRKDQE